MIHSTVILFLIYLATYLAQFEYSLTNQPSYTNNPSSSILAVDDSSQTGIQTKNQANITPLALKAMDRECGSCHHSNRSTNAKALAVYNLSDSCWYCKLTLNQVAAFSGRMKGSGFSEEEKAAINSLINKVNKNNL